MFPIRYCYKCHCTVFFLSMHQFFHFDFSFCVYKDGHLYENIRTAISQCYITFLKKIETFLSYYSTLLSSLLSVFSKWKNRVSHFADVGWLQQNCISFVVHQLFSEPNSRSLNIWRAVIYLFFFFGFCNSDPLTFSSSSSCRREMVKKHSSGLIYWCITDA